MSVHLLDTNIWIALSRAEPGPVAKLRKLAPSQVASCSVVRAELFFGARRSRRVAENPSGFRHLLEPFVLLPFDDLAADHHGILRATLEQSGTPIGANDLLIASMALAHDCVLVTRNSPKFERVAGLRVEAWL